MTGSFSTDEKDHRLLEGTAGVREDQEQKCAAPQESQPVRWSWNAWCVVGTEGRVYENGQGKVRAGKDLRCHTEGAGLYPADHVRPSGAL